MRAKNPGKGLGRHPTEDNVAAADYAEKQALVLPTAPWIQDSKPADQLITHH